MDNELRLLDDLRSINEELVPGRVTLLLLL